MHAVSFRSVFLPREACTNSGEGESYHLKINFFIIIHFMFLYNIVQGENEKLITAGYRYSVHINKYDN